MAESETAHGLARGWIEAWVRLDMRWLRERLAEGFIHVSPFGRLVGRDHYLATVEPMARKSVARLEIKDIVADGDRAGVYFVNHSAGGAIPSCDWVQVQEGKIVSVRSFYDTAALGEVLSDEDRRNLDSS